MLDSVHVYEDGELLSCELTPIVGNNLIAQTGGICQEVFGIMKPFKYTSAATRKLLP